MPRPEPERPCIVFRMSQEEVDDIDRRVVEDNEALAAELGIPVGDLREALGKVTRSSKIRDWIAAGRAAEDRKAARKIAKVSAR